MLGSTRLRAVVIVVLLCLQAGLLVWAGSLGPAPAAWAFPDEDALERDYDAHVGERVDITGSVVDTEPITIVASSDGGEIRLTVRGASGPVQSGDELRVYGVVENGRSIRSIASRAVSSGERLYMYVASLLAGVWVAGRLLRYWRVAETSTGLTPRQPSRGPLASVKEWVSRRLEEGRDA
jgi:hypothetical protein